MTDCEAALWRAILRLANTAGEVYGVTVIADEANVSYRHARRCLSGNYPFKDMLTKILIPGKRARIIIKKERHSK